MANKNTIKLRTPEECPVCGESVPPGALACPECGADHRSGWREDAASEEAEDGFDYDAFVGEEFGETPAKPAHLSMFWWIVGLVVTAALIILLLRGAF